MADPPAVLVLRALGLGDLLTAVPALRGVRAALPGHRVVLAAPAALGPLAALTGAVDEVLDASGLDAPLPWSGPPPRVAVNLHGRGPRSHLRLLALRPGRLVAYPGPGADGPVWDEGEHEVRRWCRLVAAGLGAVVDPGRLDLAAPAQGSPAPGAVVVHPGAAYGSRRWPPERFASVAAALRARGHRVVVTGGPGEEPLVARVGAGAGLDRGDLFPATLGLVGLAALVAGARLLVCGDTGVAHLATAYRCPSVVLFGPAPPARWGPPPGRARHVALWRGGRGGGGALFADEPDPGLLAVTVAEVLDAAARALAAGRADPRPSAGVGAPAQGYPPGMQDTLMSLFDGYYRDLASLTGLVRDHLHDREPPNVDLVGKLVLETARVVVYEQWFLLPAVRDALPGGDDRAFAEAERVQALAQRSRELEHLPVRDPRFAGALQALADAVAALGDQRRRELFPALAGAMDERALAAAGERVTPTRAPGSTHSHPSTARISTGRWPQPGFTDEMIRAFVTEVTNREPGAVPVRA